MTFTVSSLHSLLQLQSSVGCAWVACSAGSRLLVRLSACSDVSHARVNEGEVSEHRLVNAVDERPVCTWQSGLLIDKLFVKVTAVTGRHLRWWRQNMSTHRDVFDSGACSQTLLYLLELAWRAAPPVVVQWRSIQCRWRRCVSWCFRWLPAAPLALGQTAAAQTHQSSHQILYTTVIWM